MHDESSFPYMDRVGSSSQSFVPSSSSVNLRPLVVQLPISVDNSRVSSNTNASLDTSLSLSSSPSTQQQHSKSFTGTSDSPSVSTAPGSRTTATLSNPNSMLSVLHPNQLQVQLHGISSSSLTTLEKMVSSQGIQTRLRTGTITRKDYAALSARFPEVQSLNLADDDHFSRGFTFLADIHDAFEPSSF